MNTERAFNSILTFLICAITIALSASLSAQDDCPDSWLNPSTSWAYYTHGPLGESNFEVIHITYESDTLFNETEYLSFRVREYLFDEWSNIYYGELINFGITFEGEGLSGKIYLRASNDSLFYLKGSNDQLAFVFNAEEGTSWDSGLSVNSVPYWGDCTACPYPNTVSTNATTGFYSIYNYSDCAANFAEEDFGTIEMDCAGYYGKLVSFVGPIDSFLLPRYEGCEYVPDAIREYYLGSFDNGIVSLEPESLEFPFGMCFVSYSEANSCDDGICSNGIEVWSTFNCACVTIEPDFPPCTDDGDAGNGIEFFNSETCTCDTTFVGSISQIQTGFSIYPNPTSETITLNSGLDLQRNGIDVKVIDPSGRLVLSSTLSFNSGTASLSLANGLAAGVYFLQIVDGERDETIKFIKQ